MPWYRAFLQTLGATLLMAGLLACGGSSAPPEAETTFIVSGTATYSRVPLAKDAQGVPTGLVDASVATNLKSLPARSVFVRAYQQVEQTLPDGSKGLVWIIAKTTLTDSSGAYAMTLTRDRPTMLELLSTFYAGDSRLIHLVAEPGGIASSTPALDRVQYALRKAPDGSAPAGVATPKSNLTANAVVNFTVGLQDEWWVVNPAYRITDQTAPNLESAVLETSLPGRTPGEGTGSRVLGIGDTVATFMTYFPDATPGATLDLHYWPGRSETRGSFIEYDRSVYPQAYDSSLGVFRYFGSLRGGPVNDDAWDEGVILPLLARNHLFNRLSTRTFTPIYNPLLPPQACLPDLSPDMALIEGLAPAIAASLLESPYLADTQGTGLATPLTDVRDTSGLTPAQMGPHSAPVVRAFAWEVILKANGLTSPGTPETWPNMDPNATVRFFSPPTAATNGATDTTARDTEPLNLFTQIKRLQEAKGTAEPVDLAAIFTDSALTALGTPFGIPWPRPATGELALFVADWGTDPNTATTPIAPVTLSMALAQPVAGVYPNVSKGEVFYAGFSLNADTRYQLTVTFSPALAPGAQVELDLPRMARTFTLTGSGGALDPLIIPVNNTAPYYHPVRLRLRNPGSIHPDVAVTVGFTPIP